MSAGATSRAIGRASVFLALVFTSSASTLAEGSPRVFLLPVRDGKGEVDAELTKALRLAVALDQRGPRGWHLVASSAIAELCRRRCTVLQVRGVRGPPARFTIEARLWHAPSGRAPGQKTARRRAQLVATTRARLSAFLLAQALLRRCRALIASAARPAPRDEPAATKPGRQEPTQRAEVEEPPTIPSRPAAPVERPRRHAFDVGPSLLFGLDRSFLLAGAEVGATFPLGALVCARATLGFVGFGSDAVGERRVTYRALPLTVLLGLRWQSVRFALAAFSGLSVMALWVDLQGEGPPATESNEAILGALLETRGRFYLSEHWSVGLGLRAVLVPDRVDMEDRQGGRFFVLPHALLQTTLTVAYRL
jgi:hypothetical protein